MNRSDGVPGWILVTVIVAGLVVGLAALVTPPESTGLLDGLLGP